MQTHRLFIRSAFVWPLLAGNAAMAATVQLAPNKDNTLYEDASGSLSNGKGDHLFVGRTQQGAGQDIRRALLAFDLSGTIPAGAIVSAATLQLNVSQSNSGPALATLHRVTQDWGEGGSDAPGAEGGGTGAQAGDATWKYTHWNQSTWSSPGGDFQASASAGSQVGGTGSTAVWGGPGLVADIAFWLANPNSNFGWIVIGDESDSGTAKRLDRLQNAVAASRPILTVEFTPVPLPPAFLLLASGWSLLLALTGQRRR